MLTNENGPLILIFILITKAKHFCIILINKTNWDSNGKDHMIVIKLRDHMLFYALNLCTENCGTKKYFKTSNIVFITLRCTSWSFPHSWLITGFVTRLTRWVPLVEQELLTLRSTRDHPRCMSLFVLFYFFWHFVVCSSSIYGFWLPLWYLQTLLTYLMRGYSR